MPHEQEPTVKLDQYLFDIAALVAELALELASHAHTECVQAGARCPNLLCDLAGDMRRTGPHQPVRAGHQHMAHTRHPGDLLDHPVLGRHHRSVSSGKAVSSTVS